MRFWWTPASSHQMRLVSGSSLSNGADAVDLADPPPARRLVLQIDERGRPPRAAARLREPPAAEVVGARDDAGPDALGHPGAVDEAADAVSTRTRSPVSTPSRRASSGCIQSGLVCESSVSHFALPERVWISVGSRNVGTSAISPLRGRAPTSGRGSACTRARRARASPSPPASASRTRACATASGSPRAPRRRSRRRPSCPPRVDQPACRVVGGALELLRASGFSCVSYTSSSTRNAPYWRMYSSGVRPSFAAASGRPGTRVLEDPAVVLVDRSFSPGRYGDSKYWRMPSAAVGIDAPRQLDPELVLLPHLAGPRLVRLPRPLDLLARRSQHLAQHRLAEADPPRRVRLLAHEVVALGAVAHRQHVVGEPGRLAPGRRERGVALDLRLVGQHLDPRQPVGVRPHRVVDAREVHRELAAAPLRKWGSRKIISWSASGYSRGIRSSLHTLAGGGIRAARARTCWSAGWVPPGVATAPVRTTRNSSARATCQPPRLPAAALRQTCVASAEPGAADLARDLDDRRGGDAALLARRPPACTTA